MGNILLIKILRSLVYLKRALWWAGERLGRFLEKIFSYPFKFFVFVQYKLLIIIRRLGITNTREWLLKRDFLQIVIFICLGVISLPHTKLLTKADPLFAGKKTIAYILGTHGQDDDFEEIVVEQNPNQPTDQAFWRQGAIENEINVNNNAAIISQEFTGVVAGGLAIRSPIIIPGVSVGQTRNQIIEYIVEPGDSLGSIAYDFGVSIPTIMWANNLTMRSIIRPGDTLKILPVSGVAHTVRKNDTLKRIASLYGVETETIISFNHLKENGSDLQIGEKIIVPGGTQPESRAVPTSIASRNISQVARRIAAPPGSASTPSLSGFVWPTVSRLVTQYFGWKHHALDIAGPWQSAVYAAKSGVVDKSQCGWNGGYGCYIIISHGGGIKTLYAHNSQLLVSPGETVQTGQPIALMGNTGHVRGVTGIHLHFEIFINSVRVNPFGYVR